MDKSEKRDLENVKQRGMIDYVYCAQCGKYVTRHRRQEFMYGSPIRKCPFCHDIYVDKHYKEIAIDGIPDSEKKRIKPFCIILIIIGVISLLMGIFYTAAYIYIIIGVILIIIFSGLQIYYIVNHDKIQKDIAFETVASKKRFSDLKYVQLLEECGFNNVPHKYLYSPDWDEITRRIEEYKATHDDLK